MSHLQTVNMTLFVNANDLRKNASLTHMPHINIEHIDAKCHVVTLIVKLLTISVTYGYTSSLSK